MRQVSRVQEEGTVGRLVVQDVLQGDQGREQWSRVERIMNSRTNIR